MTLSDQASTCTHPEGPIETVGWEKLHAILIKTTDTGPFAADVSWILVGAQGATGEHDLIHMAAPMDVARVVAFRHRMRPG